MQVNGDSTDSDQNVPGIPWFPPSLGSAGSCDGYPRQHQRTTESDLSGPVRVRLRRAQPRRLYGDGRRAFDTSVGNTALCPEPGDRRDHHRADRRCGNPHLRRKRHHRADGRASLTELRRRHRLWGSSTPRPPRWRTVSTVREPVRSRAWPSVRTARAPRPSGCPARPDSGRPPPFPANTLTRIKSFACAGATRCVGVGYGPGGAIVSSPTTGFAPTVDVPTLPIGVSITQLTKVTCPDAATCVAIGNGVVSGTASPSCSSGVITTGGDTWSVVALPTAPSPTSLSQVVCPTAATCLAIGSTGASGVVRLGSPRRSVGLRHSHRRRRSGAVPST